MSPSSKQRRSTDREELFPWIIFALTLLSVGGFIWYTQLMEYRHIHSWERNRLVTQAKMAEDNLIRQIGSIRRALEGIRGDIPYWQQKDKNWSGASLRMSAMSDAMPAVRTFIITDAEGHITASNRPELMGRNFQQRDYFKVPSAAPDPAVLYISPPFKTTFGLVSVNVGLVVIDTHGRFAGIVSATLSPEYLTVLLNSMRSSPDMHVMLFHGAGTPFLEIPQQKDDGRGRQVAAELFNNHRAGGSAAEVITDMHTTSGRAQIVVSRTIQPPGMRMDNSLVVVMSQDMFVPYEEWRQDSLIVALLFGAFSLILGGGLLHFQKRQRAARSHERLLGTLADVIPGLLSYWDTGLICRFANKGYSSWFGKSQEEMAGMHLRDLLGDELFLKDEVQISRVLRGEELHFERVLKVADGSSQNVWVNYMPDQDRGQARGFYVLVTNVTELKQAQHQLEELNKELLLRTEEAEQANRSKSRFLATVAHEFRTPLSLLTSSTDILDRYGERLNSEERLLQHEHIRSAARQMATLVDSVLAFNRLGTPIQQNSPVEIDVTSFCTALADEVHAAWGLGHTFTVTIAADCGTAQLDEQLLRRVIENLLTNAFRYTKSDGTVSFRVSREGHTLHFVIEDSGIGIPVECQTRIFEAFYRCRNVESRRGLGLGLSIVHEALIHLGGSISIDSTPGRGTAMSVEIPAGCMPHPEEQQICIPS